MASKNTVEGFPELDRNVKSYLKATSQRENKFLKAAGKIVGENLERLTPIDLEADGVHMKDDVQVSGIKNNAGDKFIEIGFSKKTAYRVHFPNFGTIGVRPQKSQDFIGKADEESQKAIMNIAEQMMKGD